MTLEPVWKRTGSFHFRIPAIFHAEPIHQEYFVMHWLRLGDETKRPDLNDRAFFLVFFDR
ncbi:MAG TPA: hypothetical protein DDW24_11620 [Blastocatellia bacterium]|nr:hypothetical protein [Blastocatellia bacterium]